ncbi:GLEYA domain-containing protein [Annulohypoxylon maeteangense]|uniref:GLEYA domain-containing protein n=1 Tax=Annulohypoxylon maeteangense TaxID=1927788 RepID=UPI002008DFB6|nr:GLEYA domain-containing protein [Annulohypoxylon maeteangense]KAI0890667.1 GLEYA domain-containing protein [Annulohypoxylon maeteangense]
MKSYLQALPLLLASVPLSTATIPPITSCLSCLKPIHCDNVGWDWAYYSNPLTDSGEGYPGFRADVYKTRQPLYTGVTPSIGGHLGLTATSPDVTTFYGSTEELNATHFAINHHAYLYACENGSYQFDITYVDDAVFAWVGETAYSGWTDANRDAKAAWTPHGDWHSGSASFRKDLEIGSFNPLRFVFGNGQGGGAFNLTITSPSGVIVHQSGQDSDYIVRYSCDLKISAPEFPAFGAET